MNKLFMVFDVESVGLHGEGFAVGFVVIDDQGNELEKGLYAVDPSTAFGEQDDREWVAENVLPSLPSWEKCDPLGFGFDVPGAIRRNFWAKWLHWKEKGALLVSDCAWPVETHFLAMCIGDPPEERKWQGPYPLLDVSSILFAVGKDPVGTFERKANELPAHNPLCDARQSARILVETLKEIRDMRPALAFAQSVIKCGEPWTDTCEKVIGGALGRKPPDTP